MSCEICLATAIRAKLGRCPVCAIQTLVIGLTGWTAWWWLGADSSVNALTALLFGLAGSALFALHLLVFVWRKIRGRELD
ncbi:DUF3624 domain-containing protein [Aeromonas molluscorum]|uniref:DUF3624 domain-containing protein n=1 Tax=Aeromonas molluscorum 848 TaxID=1268236 RepID=R1HE12_9GAMM|nr:DUF3624 domain-containing protein [Aeromonas molluscorum]EOD56614.1 hypothetical protein G113_02524 [Aeromonas molluscorum 848]